MNKRILPFALSLVLCSSLPIPAFAGDGVISSRKGDFTIDGTTVTVNNAGDGDHYITIEDGQGNLLGSGVISGSSGSINIISGSHSSITVESDGEGLMNANKKPDDAGDSGNPGESENPGGSENPDDSGNTGGNGNPGGSENPGDSESTGGNGNPGDSGNPDGNGNTGDSENPSGSGNAGGNGNADGSGNTGGSGDADDSGNISDSENSDNGINTGFSIKSKSNESSIGNSAGKGSKPDTSAPLQHFYDVAVTDWYKAAVEFVSSHGMMTGSNGRFLPHDYLTRGMMAQILYNLEGATGEGTESFLDVTVSDWFANAVMWVSSKGLMDGYNTGSFGPNDPITREQLAVILYRYAEMKGYSAAASMELSAFIDGANTSNWASEAVRWAAGVELLTGKSGNRLDPIGTATRAEVAQMLMNFYIQVAA